MSDTSIYPIGIDGYEQLPLVVDNVTPVDADSVNRLRSAIVNIERELGTNPSLDKETVAEFLSSLDLRVDAVELILENIDDLIDGVDLIATNSLSYLLLNISGKVPESVGIRYFSIGDVPTSAVPLVFSKDVKIASATIKTNSTDVQNYDVVILKNGVEVDFFTLTAGSTFTSATFENLTIEKASELSLRIERASGSLKSVFSNAIVAIEFQAVSNA